MSNDFHVVLITNERDHIDLITHKYTIGFMKTRVTEFAHVRFKLNLTFYIGGLAV